MAIRSISAALSWASSLVGRYIYSGYCLKFVRLSYNVPAKYSTASIAWANTKYRHTGTPPKGAIVWWTGGAKGYGHVAISAGGGYVYSTDAPYSGRVGKVAISWFARNWPRHVYRGWSEDINGVRVMKVASTTIPTVSYSKVRSAAINKSFGGPSVLVVQKALKRRFSWFDYSSGPGWFGSKTRYAYRKWQESLGYTGSDADGIPGLTSLRKLGARYGFKVVS